MKSQLLSILSLLIFVQFCSTETKESVDAYRNSGLSVTFYSNVPLGKKVNKLAICIKNATNPTQTNATEFESTCTFDTTLNVTSDNVLNGQYTYYFTKAAANLSVTVLLEVTGYLDDRKTAYAEGAFVFQPNIKYAYVTLTLTEAGPEEPDAGQDAATDTGALSSEKEVTQFTILGINGVISGNSISLKVPYGTDVTNLTPSIFITGVSVSPASGVAQNFTSPVVYTVTAEDGSTKAYTVTVNVALSSSKEITQFTILDINGVISGSSISLTVPYGTDVTDLTPTIVIIGDNVSPGSGVARDFTNPVVYTVTAADGSAKAYTVTVTAALSDAKEITHFEILGVNGSINGTAISLTLPYGTDVTDLTPSIVITGASVLPASDVAQNFTNPVVYTVTAADSSTKEYTVTVGLELNPAKEITRFQILGLNGSINGTTITLAVPFGSAMTALTPTIAITGASVDPLSGVAQDFSHSAITPFIYTVTAANSTTKQYSVTVTEQPPTVTLSAPVWSFNGSSIVWINALSVANGHLFFSLAYYPSWEGVLNIYDISTPATPIARGTYNWSNFGEPTYLGAPCDTRAMADGNTVFIDSYDYVAAIDTTDKNAPTFLSTLAVESSNFTYRMLINGSFLYAPLSNAGFERIDISNLGDISLDNVWKTSSTGGEFTDLLLYNGYVYLTNADTSGSNTKGLYMANLSSFGVGAVTSVDVGSAEGYSSLAQYSNYLYTSLYQNGSIYGLGVYDIANPATPTWVRTVSAPGDFSPPVYQTLADETSRLLFVLSRSSGLLIYFLGDPANPAQVERWYITSSGGTPHLGQASGAEPYGMAYADGYLYIASYSYVYSYQVTITP